MSGYGHKHHGDVTNEHSGHDHASKGHAGHDHGGVGHSHAQGASTKRLIVALCLTGSFLVAEVVGGIVFESLALLSDAAHMFTDVTALVIALLAIRIGQRPPDDKRTFGYRRLEILAAAVNAVLLFAAAMFVVAEGIKRISAPAAVQSLGMLVVAGLGLAINLISMRVLAGGKEQSLNVRGAYLEVWADMVGSIGVIAAALVIRFTGWIWVDPVVAIAIGLWVLPRTWALLRDTSDILLEGAPRGVVVADIRADLLSVPGVAGIHDLHVWISGADKPTCSVHVVLTPSADQESVRHAVTARLVDRHKLSHVTVQTERENCAVQQGHR